MTNESISGNTNSQTSTLQRKEALQNVWGAIKNLFHNSAEQCDTIIALLFRKGEYANLSKNERVAELKVEFSGLWSIIKESFSEIRNSFKTLFRTLFARNRNSEPEEVPHETHDLSQEPSTEPEVTPTHESELEESSKISTTEPEAEPTQNTVEEKLSQDTVEEAASVQNTQVVDSTDKTLEILPDIKVILFSKLNRVLMTRQISPDFAGMLEAMNILHVNKAPIAAIEYKVHTTEPDVTPVQDTVEEELSQNTQVVDSTDKTLEILPDIRDILFSKPNRVLMTRQISPDFAGMLDAMNILHVNKAPIAAIEYKGLEAANEELDRAIEETCAHSMAA